MNESDEKILNDFIDKQIKSKNLISKDEILDNHNHDNEKHSHAVRSFDKFCPECSQKNPGFKESEYFCADCLTPIGSIEDLENSKVCYNCGSLDAINQEKLLEKKAGEIND
jgi:DNA-directed RNA polymerase alpha subunit